MQAGQHQPLARINRAAGAVIQRCMPCICRTRCLFCQASPGPPISSGGCLRLRGTAARELLATATAPGQPVRALVLMTPVTAAVFAMIGRRERDLAHVRGLGGPGRGPGRAHRFAGQIRPRDRTGPPVAGPAASDAAARLSTASSSGAGGCSGTWRKRPVLGSRDGAERLAPPGATSGEAPGLAGRLVAPRCRAKPS